MDYIGVVQEIPVCFDAKECASNTFPLTNIHKHQYEFMKEFEEQGGISFILIHFDKIGIIYYLRYSELKKNWESKIDINIKDLCSDYKIDIRRKIKIPIIEKIQLDIDER